MYIICIIIIFENLNIVTKQKEKNIIVENTTYKRYI